MSKNLSKGSIIGICAAVAVGFLALVGISSALGAAGTGARMENQIEATQNDNRQVLGQYTLRIAEMAQVPAMARDDLALVMERALDARYGENGSQAVFQWIQESYPGQLDNQLYRNIQTEISSGRVAFASNQTRLLDQKRVYENQLDQPVSGFWLRLVGYPKMDLSKITVVSSDAANRAFERGVDEGLTLRREEPAAPAAPVLQARGGAAG